MSKDQAKPRKLTPKRKAILIILALFFLLAGLIYGIYWLLWGHFLVETEDAYVNGNMVQLNAQISGAVVSIYADDTQPVIQGQPLVKIDDTDMLIALEKARSSLAETVRQVRGYYENVSQLQADLALRQADLVQAQKDLQRRVGLVNTGALSNEELTHFKTSVQTAQAQYNSALHELSSAKALVVNSQLYNHPQVRQAETTFKEAYLNWVRTVIYAPSSGYVAKRNAQVGQQITTSTPLLAVIPLNQIWVDANYKENQLSRLRIGQKVALSADVNGVTYRGWIAGFSPGTGSAFAILPPQNATGNWIKIVQRLAVRIVIDPQELQKHPLQLGLSMKVTVHTRGLKGAILSTVPNNKPLYSTWIFNNQLRQADREIRAILESNAPNIKNQDSPVKSELARG